MSAWWLEIRTGNELYQTLPSQEVYLIYCSQRAFENSSIQPLFVTAQQTLK